MARLSISPAEIDSHTPSISKICGNTSTGITIKMIVRQKDRIAEVLPSFSAVNQPDTYDPADRFHRRVIKCNTVPEVA